MEKSTTRPRIFFLGSCVSRDMARIVDVSDRFEIGPYVARQSWISAFSDPTPLPEKPSALKSKFQRRMVESDLQSSIPRVLSEEAATTDAILVDIIDERYGVVPTENGYITNSYELRNSKWKSSLARGDVLPFGSDRHFNLWKTAARRLIDHLVDTELLERAYLVDTLYAQTTSDGGNFDNRTLSPSVRNEQFAPYYSFLRECGFRRIVMPDSVTVADAGHAWGLEPFHFIADYYHYMADELEGLIRDGGESARV